MAGSAWRALRIVHRGQYATYLIFLVRCRVCIKGVSPLIILKLSLLLYRRYSTLHIPSLFSAAAILGPNLSVPLRVKYIHCFKACHNLPWRSAAPLPVRCVAQRGAPLRLSGRGWTIRATRATGKQQV